MRKLREAAVVAAMVGSASVLGIGVASAHAPGGGEENGNGTVPTLVCNQDSGDNSQTTQVGLINVGDIVLGGSGDALANPTQQICGIGNSNNAQDGGDVESGAGGDGTLGVSVGL